MSWRLSFVGRLWTNQQSLTCLTRFVQAAHNTQSATDPFYNPGDKYYDNHWGPKGKIHAKRPFKIKVEEGKALWWCACGHSKQQPLCDGTHAIKNMKIVQKPVRFISPETKQYWLCNCKQTDRRPFCDGSHIQKEVQESRAMDH